MTTKPAPAVRYARAFGNVAALLVAFGGGLGLGWYLGVKPPIDRVIPVPDSLRTGEPIRADLSVVRDSLRLLVWGDTVLPALLPAVEPAAVGRFDDTPGARSVDRLTVTMDGGVESIGYLIWPASERGAAIIYQEGHVSNFALGARAIERFVAAGHPVVALALPLFQPNNQPIIDHPRLGRIRIFSHDQLQYVPVRSGHPLRLFLDPILAAANHLETLGRENIALAGLSGGGWATTVYAALDDRIRRSYPVAGSLPSWMRNAKDVGHWEDNTRDLLDVANYSELYALGARGRGRAQTQIVLRRDQCCFAARETPYVDAVRKAVGQHGSFDVWIDETAWHHGISDATIDFMLADLAGSGEP